MFNFNSGFGDDSGFGDFDFMEMLSQQKVSPDGLRADFTRTGIRDLDKAIARCMDLSDQIQSIGKK